MSNAARPVAAPHQHRPAIAASANTSLRQVMPPLGNSQAYRSTPPTVIGASPHAGSHLTGHGGWPQSRTPASSHPALAASAAAAVKSSQQHLPGGPGSAVPMGPLGKDRSTAYASPYTQLPQQNQHHQPPASHLGAHRSTAHSQFSSYRPSASGMTVTSLGPGMHLPPASSSMLSAAPSQPSSAQRSVGLVPGQMDAHSHLGTASAPASTFPAYPPQQAGAAAPRADGSWRMGAQPNAPSLHANDQAHVRSPGGQQRSLHSPLGVQSGSAAGFAPQQRQHSPSHAGQNGSYWDKPAGLLAQHHAAPWQSQQHSGAPLQGHGAHQQQEAFDSRLKQSLINPSIGHTGRVGSPLPPQSGWHGHEQNAQHSQSGSQPSGRPMHESQLPQGLAYGTSTWTA